MVLVPHVARGGTRPFMRTEWSRGGSIGAAIRLRRVVCPGKGDQVCSVAGVVA